MKMLRTKTLTANGYSLEASFKFDEETNVLDMDVNLTAGMHVNIEYNEGKYDVVRTKYIPQEYDGTLEKHVRISQVIRRLFYDARSLWILPSAPHRLNRY